MGIVFIECLQMQANELNDLLLGRPIRFREFLLALDQVTDRLFRHQVEQFFLALDMVIETALEHAYFVGNILNGGRVVSLLFEQFGRSCDDLLAPRRAHTLTLYPLAFSRSWP